jgi:ribosome-binding factor A
MSVRHDRLSSVILRGAQSVVSEGFNDPRLDECLITVTGVKLDRDLTTAVLRVSVLPEKAERRALAGLQAASRHIRRQTADRVSVHRMPKFEFRLDRSAKRQMGVLDALARARAEDEQRGGHAGDAGDTDGVAGVGGDAGRGDGGESGGGGFDPEKRSAPSTGADGAGGSRAGADAPEETGT